MLAVLPQHALVWCIVFSAQVYYHNQYIVVVYNVIVENGDSCNNCPSAGLTASIKSAPKGMVLDCCGIWCMIRCGCGRATENQGHGVYSIDL